MKTLRTTLLALYLLCAGSFLLAQSQGKIENGFNVENFPEVSFIYHSHCPEILKRADFWHLKEAGSDRTFSVKRILSEPTEQSQTTLILWEDMAHNGYGQFNFTQKVLNGFFNQADIPSSDRFFIAAFNRRKNARSSLIGLTDKFTEDVVGIIRDINDYRHSTEHYPEFPNRSDMYSAIREGLDMLAPIDGVKSIIVFTAGYSMKNSGSESESQVLLKAQQLHIPVYIFQYYYKSGVAPESEGFAKGTFGTFKSYIDATEAKLDLINLYPRITERYNGNSYRITFQSQGERGSEARMVSLCVKGIEIQEQLLPPSYTFASWIKANPLIFALILLVFAAAVVLLILFVKKSQERARENKKGLEELERRRIQDKEKEEIRRKAEEEKKRLEREAIEKQKEINNLQHLMSVKNLYPRLKCRSNSKTFTYDIFKPITSIGRDGKNDVVLSENDGKASRQHAEILFTGNGFEIVDKKSTNGILLNGCSISRAALKSGDLITLGESVITFVL